MSVPAQRATLLERLPRARSLPQIFLDGQHISDETDLKRLADAGQLEARAGDG